MTAGERPLPTKPYIMYYFSQVWVVTVDAEGFEKKPVDVDKAL